MGGGKGMEREREAKFSYLVRGTEGVKGQVEGENFLRSQYFQCGMI